MGLIRIGSVSRGSAMQRKYRSHAGAGDVGLRQPHATPIFWFAGEVLTRSSVMNSGSDIVLGFEVGCGVVDRGEEACRCQQRLS